MTISLEFGRTILTKRTKPKGEIKWQSVPTPSTATPVTAGSRFPIRNSWLSAFRTRLLITPICVTTRTLTAGTATSKKTAMRLSSTTRRRLSVWKLSPPTSIRRSLPRFVPTTSITLATLSKELKI